MAASCSLQRTICDQDTIPLTSSADVLFVFNSGFAELSTPTNEASATLFLHVCGFDLTDTDAQNLLRFVSQRPSSLNVVQFLSCSGVTPELLVSVLRLPSLCWLHLRDVDYECEDQASFLDEVEKRVPKLFAEKCIVSPEPHDNSAADTRRYKACLAYCADTLLFAPDAYFEDDLSHESEAKETRD